MEVSRACPLRDNFAGLSKVGRLRQPDRRAQAPGLPVVQPNVAPCARTVVRATVKPKPVPPVSRLRLASSR